MQKHALKSCCAGAAMALVLLALPARAEAGGASATLADDGAVQDEIVVTGVARAANRLDTSISISALAPADIAAAAPRSTAEILRTIPGMRSESSGGEGNANIQVRGIPISTGGAKFLQIEEDGLPVLEFGDIAFGNADIFTRVDFSTARVEALRGGSASTLASNSPAGIINFLSKTGEAQGGAIQATAGLDYGEYRIDADYGMHPGDGLTARLGGFYRVGEGPRRAGYDGNRGGQIRGNITRDFSGGFLRVNFRYLDDRAVSYLPGPVRVKGSNADPHYEALPGLSPNSDTIQSSNFTRAVTLDGANNREVDDIRDGMHPVVKAAGFEFEDAFAAGWTVNDKFRYADISGRFISPFPATVDMVDSLATAIGGAGALATYANGPKAGAAVPGDAFAMGVVLFNVRLNSLDNVTNDLRLGHHTDLGGGRLDLSLGYYRSRQTIDMDWLWSSYLLEAKGDNAALINVSDAGGAPQTDNGLVAYGASFFGDCCRRAYNLHFDTSAPYLQASWNTGPLTLDGSVRHDAGRARGYVAGDGPVGTFDVDGNGAISVPETRVTTMPLAARRPVSYDYGYWSYSGGVNYRLGDALALFARYSRGGRANADRFVFSGHTSPTTGALLPNSRPIDFVQQAEAGVKYRTGAVRIDATAFWARTQEQNYEATTQTASANTYRAYGVELEGRYRIGRFSLAANGTWTSARIVASLDPAVIGNRPRRQADFMFTLAPTFAMDRFTVGASATGTTASYAQDVNQLKLPGFTQFDAFVSVRPLDRLELSLNAKNLFDVTGFTEAEEGTIPANGIVRARSINARTVSASVKVTL